MNRIKLGHVFCLLLVYCQALAPAAGQVSDVSVAAEKIESSHVTIELETSVPVVALRGYQINERNGSGIALLQTQEAKESQAKQIIHSQQSGVVVVDTSTILTVLPCRPSEGNKYSVRLGAGKQVAIQPIVYDEVTGCSLLRSAEPITGCKPIAIAPTETQLGAPLVASFFGGAAGVVVRQGIVASRDYWDRDLAMVLFELDIALPSYANGGGVFNLQGELLGLVVESFLAPGPATLKSFQGTQIIPISALAPILTISDLNTKKTLYRGMFGVKLKNPEDASGQGVVIESVSRDLPASRNGLVENDRILAVDGNVVKTANELSSHVHRKRAGDVINLTVVRRSRESENAPAENLSLELEKTSSSDLRERQATLYSRYLPPEVSSRIPFTVINPSLPGSAVASSAPNAAGQVFPQYQVPLQQLPPRIEIERSSLEESIRDLSRQIEVLKKELNKRNSP